MKTENKNVIAEIPLIDEGYGRSVDKIRLEAKLIVFKTKNRTRDSYGSIITYKPRRSQNRYRKSFGPYASFVEAIDKALRFWYGI